MRLLQPKQVGALAVEHVEPHRLGQAQDRGPRPAGHRLQLQGAQGLQGRGLGRADAAGAVAGGADVGRALQHAHAAALAADLHQAEGADPAHLHPGAILLEAVLQHLLDGAVVLALVHVDEVDHDQARQVAQAQLARGLLGRLKVGLERGLLDVALAGGAARVDVDGHQGLGLVDHEIAARAQGHDGRVDQPDLVLHPVAHEQRRGVLVVDHLVGLAGHDQAHELARLAVPGLALDLDAVELLVEHVAHRALHQVLLGVDQGGAIDCRVVSRMFSHMRRR